MSLLLRIYRSPEAKIWLFGYFILLILSLMKYIQERIVSFVQTFAVLSNARR